MYGHLTSVDPHEPHNLDSFAGSHILRMTWAWCRYNNPANGVFAMLLSTRAGQPALQHSTYCITRQANNARWL